MGDLADNEMISDGWVILITFAVFALVWLAAGLVATIWLDAMRSFIVGWIACHVVLVLLVIAGYRREARDG